MARLHLLLVTAYIVCIVSSNRVKRQDEEEDAEAFVEKLCTGKGPAEWFRLETGADKCRDVIQCTAAGLQQIRCPSGLAFDIEKQTCDWKDSVKNCELKEKVRKVKPLLKTDEPLCEDKYLACGDASCIPQDRFCDGNPDCPDGSDENACDINSDPNRAPDCNDQCQLPECFCSESGTKVPNDLDPSSVPQMITITFDDAVNNNNIELYNGMFNGDLVNPNGCGIKATFFVSHKYSNYSAVQSLHRRGHEIAVHSITHKEDEDFWSDASVDDWAKEMAGARLIVDKYANITDNSVVGLRAPYLRVGGNNQFKMMEQQAFLYDSSITAPLQNPPLWPYTLYFKMPHRCHGNKQNCPTRSFAVWEMVMNELDRREDPSIDEDLPGCAMVDSCSNIRDGEQFYDFLYNNFERHYNSNRAPMGLFFHAAWLKNNPDYEDVLLYWIEEILAEYDDVYFVTMTQVIQWMQNPTLSTDTPAFEPWKEKCQVEIENVCNGGNDCSLTTKEVTGETFRMQTCLRCPNHYPWVSDPTGEGFF